MPQEPDSGRDPGPRPLPTVNVALLPHELKAARMRQMAVAGGVLAAVVGISAWVFGENLQAMFDSAPESEVDDDGWPVPPHRDTSATAPIADDAGAMAAAAVHQGEIAPPAPTEILGNVPALTVATTGPSNSELEPHDTGNKRRTTVEFGRARGFRDALTQAGVSGADADAIVTALQPHVDFRRCRPEHTLSFERASDGKLLTFEYRVSRTELYRAVRTADGFAGEQVPIKIDIKRVAKGGHVSGSLGQALEYTGLGRTLVGAFVEVFERSISFSKDTRDGDTFRIIVDQQYVDGEFLGYGTVHAIEYTGERAGKLQGYWFEPTPGSGDFYDAQGRANNGGWLRTPLRYDHISSRFDLRRRHPILKRIVPHQGVDYAAGSGTPVWSAADGVVHYAGYKGANGNLIAIRHDGGYETFYAHLSRIARGIKRGTHVTQRQVIGAVGTTGRSTGPHLHFALKRAGQFLDPMKHLNRPGKPLPARYMGRFRKTRAALQAELARISLAPAPPLGPELDHGPAPAEIFHEEEAL